MSRWSRRTEEDKRRILKEQERMAEKKGDGTVGDPVKVFAEGEIPMFCVKHGWVGSEKYVIGREFNPLIGAQCEMVYGECRRCGGKLKKALFGGDLLIVVAVLTSKGMKGRVEDRRGVKSD